jgi:hypothetical protein
MIRDARLVRTQIEAEGTTLPYGPTPRNFASIPAIGAHSTRSAGASMPLLMVKLDKKPLGSQKKPIHRIKGYKPGPDT